MNWSDVITSATPFEYIVILQWLKFPKIDFSYSSQRSVTVVQSAVHKRLYERMDSPVSELLIDCIVGVSDWNGAPWLYVTFCRKWLFPKIKMRLVYLFDIQAAWCSRRWTCFAAILSSPSLFFVRYPVPSEIMERNSTKTGHIRKCRVCDLKMHVPSP